MLFRPKHYIAFGGPSFSRLKQKPSWVTFFPPIRRNQLLTVLEEFDPRKSGVLIVDGVFGDCLTVTNTECREALAKGFTLVGASSIGAIRAADCATLGMIGVGYVYERFRSGKISDDSEVAVRYDQSATTEITISGARIRFMVRKLVSEGEISVLTARRLLRSLLTVPWYERLPETVEAIAWELGILPSAVSDCLSDDFNPKTIDAVAALDLISPTPW
ncbi:TfuA-like protein [Roseateles sp. MS654]|uniref:TfuA-like protein n=1 Tax=Roseateles sp. MS654 TaxID=3412685 RepID=UPI003C30D54D